MKKASGPNSNSFYQLVETPEPLISLKAKLDFPGVAKIYEYDFETKAGETILWFADNESIRHQYSFTTRFKQE